MKITVSKILSKLIGRLLEQLPLFIFARINDGKITKEELNEIKDMVITIASSVVAELSA